MTRKTYQTKKKFCLYQIFLLKNIFKVALEYLFNGFILFKTIFKLYFKLKIDPKMCAFKNLKGIWKTWKKF